jgi:diadenosine tetraphosphatase ApaH/serine/threonine PP2A family protein phosphatase
MVYLALPAVVLVAGTTAIVINRRRRARKSAVETPQATEETPQATDAATSVEDKRSRTFFTRLTGRVGNWRNRLTRRQPQDMRQQFHAWIAKACADEASLCTWLQQLPEKEEQAFIDQVAAFCTARGFELPWVVEHRLEPYPELAQTAEQVVLHYCRACHQAVAAQQDLDVYKTLLAFEHNPADGKAQGFGHKLFAKVIEEGLTSVSMSEYLLAAPKEQQQYMVRAIREAAKTNHAVFNRLLKEVVRDSAPGSTAAQPATTQARTSTGQGADAPVTSFA